MNDRLTAALTDTSLTRPTGMEQETRRVRFGE